MNPLLKKLKIKEPHILLPIQAPADFKSKLGTLPAGVKISNDKKKPFQSIHWFVQRKKDVDKDAQHILAMLSEGAMVWCYFPKGGSKIQTDLTRDKGWESLLNDEIKWLGLISFDDTWSAFSLRLKTAKEKSKPETTEKREIYQYADSVTKTIILPPDLKTALQKNKTAGNFFEQLAFSNKREYVAWIITAKRKETREARIKSTLEKLIGGKKNPTQKP